MKRKRVIVTVALLVVVTTVVATNWKTIWLVVAYERQSMQGPNAFSCGMHFLRKKPLWLPGHLIVVPNQPCGLCRTQIHRRCLENNQMRTRSGARLMFHEERLLFRKHAEATDVVLDPSSWHCTCPDQSHEWNQ